MSNSHPISPKTGFDGLVPADPGLDPGGRRTANAPPVRRSLAASPRDGSSRALRQSPLLPCGSEAREGAGAERHPRGEFVPSPFARRKGDAGTPCEGVPRPSDVGARAFAALHATAQTRTARCFGIVQPLPAPPLVSPEYALGEPGWRRVSYNFKNKSKTKCSKIRKAGKRRH